jgi:hypothetical protein
MREQERRDKAERRCDLYASHLATIIAAPNAGKHGLQATIRTGDQGEIGL